MKIGEALLLFDVGAEAIYSGKMSIKPEIVYCIYMYAGYLRYTC